jgi:MurNAc alpha-1-phosphate uridylyltransferase
MLAAGRGERMRPLTDVLPKPLLKVRSRPLLSHHLHNFKSAGYERAVVNTAWLEDKIIDYCAKNPSTTEESACPEGMKLVFSCEGRDFGGALETGGGIVRALPLLDEAFWVVGADIFAPDLDVNPSQLARFVRSPYLAHLFLVPNPAHNPGGDFGVNSKGEALNVDKDSRVVRLTYASIGLFKQDFFKNPIVDIEYGNPGGARAALAPFLRRAMDLGLVSAELFNGSWTDVGTPERLNELNARNHAQP